MTSRSWQIDKTWSFLCVNVHQQHLLEELLNYGNFIKYMILKLIKKNETTENNYFCTYQKYSSICCSLVFNKYVCKILLDSVKYILRYQGNGSPGSKKSSFEKNASKPQTNKSNKVLHSRSD